MTLLKALNNDDRIALLDNLEDLYGNGATMITSQLPVDSWYNFIDEATLANAITDRLAASAHRLAFISKSLRRKRIIKFGKIHSCLVLKSAGLAGVLYSGIIWYFVAEH